MRITKQFLNELTFHFIGAAIEGNKQLGPGLLESVYHICLVKELTLKGQRVDREIKVPVSYKGL